MECTATFPGGGLRLWSPPAARAAFTIDFGRQVELGQTVHHNTASYDPTENCGYHKPAADHPTTLEIRAAAKDFFLGRPVDVIEGHGSDPGSYEFEFDFAIALDTKNGLIFSFVWNLKD